MVFNRTSSVLRGLVAPLHPPPQKKYIYIYILPSYGTGDTTQFNANLILNCVVSHVMIGSKSFLFIFILHSFRPRYIYLRRQQERGLMQKARRLVDENSVSFQKFLILLSSTTLGSERQIPVFKEGLSNT